MSVFQPFSFLQEATGAAPPYVTDSLTFYVDASDASSYPGTGTTWTDLTTNGNNLTIVGGPSFSGTGDAKYFDLNGGNNYFQVSSINLQQSFSFETVLQIDQNSTRYNIISAGTTQDGKGLHFEYRPSRSDIEFNYSFYGGSYTSQYSNSGPISTSTWYHVVATYNHSTGAHGLYLNAVAQSPTYNSVTSNSMATSNILYMGYWNAVSNYGWDGPWALARLYYKELSSSEVTQNFNGLSSRFGL